MIQRLDCRVVAILDATRDIRVVHLGQVDDRRLAFRAGQYAAVSFASLPPRDYSMANRPGAPLLEFHVRRMGGDGVSAYVTGRLAAGERASVAGPFGGAWLRRDHPGPILALAGGSGLAPVKSIVEMALAAGMTQDIHLYFGVRDEDDLYLEDRFRALARRHANLRFVPVLSEPAQATQRRTGLLDEAVAADFGRLAGFKAYVAGPPTMVEAAVKRLAAKGLAADDIHADPFLPAGAATSG